MVEKKRRIVSVREENLSSEMTHSDSGFDTGGNVRLIAGQSLSVYPALFAAFFTTNHFSPGSTGPMFLKTATPSGVEKTVFAVIHFDFSI